MTTMATTDRDRELRLRKLLDMRAQRADIPPPPASIHGREHSLSTTDYSSPSSSSVSGFVSRTPQPPQSRHLTDRERLADPACSGLDLSDDPRMSVVSSSLSLGPPSSDEEHHDSANAAQSHMPTDSLHPMSQNDSGRMESHMSFLGPRMKIHSPAPWDMDDPEQDPGAVSDSSSTRTTATAASKRRLRNPFGGGLRFGRGNNHNSDERTSSDSGSSMGRKSVDTVTHGALHALALASQASLAKPLQPPQQLRNKLSLGRLRTGSRPTPSLNTSLLHDTASLNPPKSPGARSFRHEPLSPSDLEPHPFANPELSPVAPGGAPRFFPANNTITHNTNPTSPLSMSVPPRIPYNRASSSAPLSASTSSSSRTGIPAPPSLTPDSSASSVPSSSSPASDRDTRERERTRSAGGRRLTVDRLLISSPIQIGASQDRNIDEFGVPVGDRDKKLDPPWAGNPNSTIQSPTFALISLAEAQAQVRARSRTTTAEPTAMGGVTSLQVPVPETPDSRPRTRARSTSIGMRLKKVTSSPGPPLPQTTPTSGAGAGSGKKGSGGGGSGFMRLFRDKDKDRGFSSTPGSGSSPMPSPALAPLREAASPPATPVDAFPEAIMPLPISNAGGAERIQRQRSLSKRVPVPALHLDAPTPPMGGPTSGSPTPLASENPGALRPRKRTPPALNLDASLPRSAPGSGHHDGQQGHGRQGLGLAPDANTMGSRSAPPEASTFTGLSLRPVSTVFSAHFAGHIVPDSPPAPVSRPLHIIERDEDDEGSAEGGPDTAITLVASPDRGNEEGKEAEGEGEGLVKQLKAQVRAQKKAWAAQMAALESEVKDLREEVATLRAGGVGMCEVCGRSGDQRVSAGGVGVLHRPRARTGVGGRFVNA